MPILNSGQLLYLGGPLNSVVVRLLANQHDFTAPPPPLPPPTLSWFTTYQERFEEGALFEPVSWLNCWHDFCVLKHTHIRRQLFVPLFA
jgi:hypothetical protein